MDVSNINTTRAHVVSTLTNPNDTTTLADEIFASETANIGVRERHMCLCVRDRVCARARVTRSVKYVFKQHHKSNSLC